MKFTFNPSTHAISSALVITLMMPILSMNVALATTVCTLTYDKGSLTQSAKQILKAKGYRLQQSPDWYTMTEQQLADQGTDKFSVQFSPISSERTLLSSLYCVAWGSEDASVRQLVRLNYETEAGMSKLEVGFATARWIYCSSTPEIDTATYRHEALNRAFTKLPNCQEARAKIEHYYKVSH